MNGLVVGVHQEVVVEGGFLVVVVPLLPFRVLRWVVLLLLSPVFALVLVVVLVVVVVAMPARRREKNGLYKLDYVSKAMTYSS